MKCPHCRAPLDAEAAERTAVRPFCSERCKMLDLARWLDGEFVLSRPMTPDEAWDAMSDRDD